MLELLFGNKNVEKIFFYLLKNEQCYASELSKVFVSSLYGFQQVLVRLERAGILASRLSGKTRIYCFNPRYPFLKELKSFLIAAYAHIPASIRISSYEIARRTRPRRAGKPLR